MASDRDPPPDRPSRPLIFELDGEPGDGQRTEAPGPADAPPVPDPLEPARDETGGAPPAAERALRRAARGGGGSWIGGLFWTGLSGLLTLAVGLWLAEFLGALFAQSVWLGWLGAGLLGALLLALTVLAVRELAALARLGRVEGLQRLARSAAAAPDPRPGERLLDGLAALYGRRPELRASEIAESCRTLGTGPEITRAAERRLMPALDRDAAAEVSRAAGRVAAVTALLPMPALDLLLVLAANIRMIRRIAEIYGGRAGWLGSWRLLKAVAQHLVATGAISATDDLLGPLVGGGILGQLSRRFGEATVNAALTARVGTAAIEVCRPLPFAALPAPKARSLVLGALKGWRGK